jgi:hypothetical protein
MRPEQRTAHEPRALEHLSAVHPEIRLCSRTLPRSQHSCDCGATQTPDPRPQTPVPSAPLERWMAQSFSSGGPELKPLPRNCGRSRMPCVPPSPSPTVRAKPRARSTACSCSSAVCTDEPNSICCAGVSCTPRRARARTPCPWMKGSPVHQRLGRTHEMCNEMKRARGRVEEASV